MHESDAPESLSCESAFNKNVKLTQIFLSQVDVGSQSQ